MWIYWCSHFLGMEGWRLQLVLNLVLNQRPPQLLKYLEWKLDHIPIDYCYYLQVNLSWNYDLPKLSKNQKLKSNNFTNKVHMHLMSCSNHFGIIDNIIYQKIIQFPSSLCINNKFKNFQFFNFFYKKWSEMVVGMTRAPQL